MKRYAYFILILVLFCSSLNCSYSEIVEEVDLDDVWICPNCNTELDTNFCSTCGAQRPEMVPIVTTETPNIPSQLDLSEANLLNIVPNWIGMKYDDVADILATNGFNFKKKDTSWAGNVYIYISDQYSFDIGVFDTDRNKKIEMIEVVFPASSTTYNTVYSSIVNKCGEPIIWAYDTHDIPVYDSARWKYSPQIEVQMSGNIYIEYKVSDAQQQFSLSYPKSGERPFHILVLENSEPIYTLPPRQTVAPTPTPAPTPKINCEISIASVKLKSSSIIPELYVVFKNNSKVTVDRIDFNVKCYNAYGSLIQSYGYYDISRCFYDENVKPKKTSKKNYSWYLDGIDGIKSVEIAITAYHQTNGRTVTIPDDQQKWAKYTFK